MTTHVDTQQNHFGGARSGLRALCVGLLLAVAWIPVAVAGIHSAFAMAWGTCLTLCAAPLTDALERDSNRWSGLAVWAVRLGAVIAGWWLLHSAGSQLLGTAALCAFALLYVGSDWAVSRKMRSNRNIAA